MIHRFSVCPPGHLPGITWELENKYDTISEIARDHGGAGGSHGRDPRNILGHAREKMQEIVGEKMRLFGCAHRIR